MVNFKLSKSYEAFGKGHCFSVFFCEVAMFFAPGIGAAGGALYGYGGL